jgi:hypothetical protein
MRLVGIMAQVEKVTVAQYQQHSQAINIGLVLTEAQVDALLTVLSRQRQLWRDAPQRPIGEAKG